MKIGPPPSPTRFADVGVGGHVTFSWIYHEFFFTPSARPSISFQISAIDILSQGGPCLA